MMGYSFPLFSLRVAFAVSLSFSISQSLLSLPTSFLPPQYPHRRNRVDHPIISSRASPNCRDPSSLASDLISLFGSKEEASRVDADTARELRSCLRFLAPLSGNDNHSQDSVINGVSPRRRKGVEDLQLKEKDVDELILWPPSAVMELASLAADSGGDPGAIHRCLDPTVHPVPDVEGCKEDRCQLTRTTYGWRFINKELNLYIAFLFETISTRSRLIGFNVSLNRYDLFHGHLFLATNSGRLVFRFHAREYPAYKKKQFPYHMGYCQTGSNVIYDDSMNFRNILWLAPLPGESRSSWISPGVLVVLDAHPGGIIYRELISEYVDYVRTIYEDDFGDLVVDVNYLNLDNVATEEKIFIC